MSEWKSSGIEQRLADISPGSPTALIELGRSRPKSDTERKIKGRPGCAGPLAAPAPSPPSQRTLSAARANMAAVFVEDN